MADVSAKTKTLFEKSLKIIEDQLDGEEVNNNTLQSALRMANMHIKLLNRELADKSYVLARQKFYFEWAQTMSENKEELKKLLEERKVLGEGK